MRFSIIGLLFVLVTAAGCSYPIQLHFPATPHFYGRVVDRETKEPVEGAVAFLKESPGLKTTSITSGYFDLAGITREFPQPIIGEITLPGDMGNCLASSVPGFQKIYGNLNLPVPSGTIVVEAQGYKRFETGLLRGMTVTGIDVELERE